jgi:hypothetical protein
LGRVSQYITSVETWRVADFGSVASGAVIETTVREF